MLDNYHFDPFEILLSAHHPRFISLASLVLISLFLTRPVAPTLSAALSPPPSFALALPSLSSTNVSLALFISL